MLFNLFYLYSVLSSLWNVSLSNYGRYNLIYNKNTIISEACPEFILSSYGTRVSLCDTTLYSAPTLVRPPQEIIVNYSPIKNLELPNAMVIFKYTKQNNSILTYLLFDNITKTNWISPMYNGIWNLGFSKTRILRVPYDNDLQSVYLSIDSDSILDKDTSHYVSSFYDDSSSSNKGMTIGFLEHNLWKTGIEFSKNTINAIAGLNGLLITRDSIPHGKVNIAQTPALYININDD